MQQNISPFQGIDLNVSKNLPSKVMIDGLRKGFHFFVIPAEAGIQHAEYILDAGSSPA